MPKISQIDEVPCQAEVRILQKITLKSLQLNRVKFSRKSYPRVGMALVLINPLYNLKISDYFWRNSMINLDKGRFPY